MLRPTIKADPTSPRFQLARPVPHTQPGSPGAQPNAGPPGGGGEGCSTIYIGGLQFGTTEVEMWQVLQQVGGPTFERLKLKPPTEEKPGMCWAKFTSPDDAELAKQTINSSRVTTPSNPMTPMECDIAKNDLFAPPDQKVPTRPKIPKFPAIVLAQNARMPLCDTLFIGGLPANLTEEDLTAAFCQQMGFESVKMVGGGEENKKPMAWVKFDSVFSASRARLAQHGKPWPIDPMQTMSCDFAKNSLGKRQRVSGDWAAPAQGGGAAWAGVAAGRVGVAGGAAGWG